MNTQNGFTIIELMIVMALAAVLLSIGIPGFQQMVQDNRRASASVEMISALQAARSESIKRNQPVSLCPSADGAGCTNGNAWEAGWIAFTDIDRDGVIDAADDDIVQSGSGLNAIAISSTFEYLTYGSNGRMVTNDGGDEAEFIMCDGRGASDGRALLVFRSGRAEMSETDLDNAAITSCRTP